MTFKRWIAIHTGAPHYLDHLGILCIQLQLPLLVTEKVTYEVGRKFYPELSIQYIELQELSLLYLATNFDVIFESGHRWTVELLPLFKLLFNKSMRMVYVPHGNSDKGHSIKTPFPKDISLVYGSHMIDLLKNTSKNQTVVTGNYRYRYFRKHQLFYEELLKPFLHKLDFNKKNILYAPSWPDGENPSSFISSCGRVIEEVGEYFNVLVRWHPFLDEIYPAEVEQIRAKYGHQKNVALLENFPCIYPILQITDGYIGDFSSVGYDFLAFDKPLFFLDGEIGKIYECGIKLLPEDHFGRVISTHQDALSSKRKQTYDYVFGRERSGSEILAEIKKALSIPRAFV